MSTLSFSAKNIKRDTQVIDASGKVLGRLSTEVARILMGKNKPQYVPYLDMGDFVVVKNAAQIKVTGKKSDQKIYHRHSGFPGGLKAETFSKLILRRPEEVVRKAIVGMLPKGRLGRKMIKKLSIYKEEPPIRIKSESKKEENGQENGS